MNVQIWHILSMAAICSTIILQVINFKKDDVIGTRILMLSKGGFFLIHVLMLIYRQTSGMFLTLGLVCLLAIYIMGYFHKK